MSQLNNSVVPIDANWTAGISGGSYVWNTTSTSTTSIDNTLQVRGNSEFDGDITVRGRSLTEFMESVEQRLNILRPNPVLESEWDQLRELGEQYRELEQQLAEKAQMWQTLKK